MSFIRDLANRSSIRATPQTMPIPMSLPDAYSGLAGTVREPYRTNAPLNSQFTPTNRPVLPVSGRQYRG